MRKSIIFLAVIAIWLFSVASSPVVTGAKVRLKAKKYEETVKVLEENKSQYSNDPELYYYLGLAYAGIANWVKTGENFSKAMSVNPPNNLKKEIDKWRDHYWAQFIKDATALQEQKRYLDAIGKYRTAITINPDRKESQFNLAVSMLEQAMVYQEAKPPQTDSAKVMFDEAIVQFKKAIEMDPENEQYQKGLCEAYIDADMMDEATVAYEKYREAHPDDNQAQRRLVLIYMNKREYDKAGEIYDALFEDAAADLSSADAYNAGTCYFQLYYADSKKEDEASKAKSKEILDKAAKCFERVFTADPTDCDAGTQLYSIYYTMQQWEKVAKTIETMFSNNCPRDYGTLEYLAAAYMNINQKDKALETLKEAESKKPKESGTAPGQAGPK